MTLEFPLDDPRRQWELSGFEITAIILLPTHSEGRHICLALLFLQTDMVKSDIRNPDDVVPRIMIAGVGEAGDPCYRFYHWISAGMAFMAQPYPRTRHEYTHHEHKSAQKQGRKLQTYSIVEVRKIEPSPGHDTPDTDSENSTQSPYHFTYSFPQRSHYRRLNQPRKSDGLQVILVAEGQKCKHLPPKCDVKLKITKVVR